MKRPTLTPTCARRPLLRPTSLRSRERSVRAGITLLEVVLSVAIFMTAFVGIIATLRLGQDQEVVARLKSEAVLRAEAVMGEIVTGVSPASSSQGNGFDDDEIGNWEWSADVTDGGVSGLLQVTVLVEHRPGGADPNAAFSLIRYMRDPQLFLDAALESD